MGESSAWQDEIADRGGNVHVWIGYDAYMDQGVSAPANGVVPAKAGTHNHRWL
jgi:hypothetical protein